MALSALEHAGDIVLLFTGFWRFLVSAEYRLKKLAEWRGARGMGGGLIVALEIVAAVLCGVVLPLWLAVLLAQWTQS